MPGKAHGNVLQRIGERSARWVERFLPSPFVFAIVLTLITYLWALAATTAGPWRLVEHWVAGFWKLLTFGMQMVLILVTGYVIAAHPRVKGGLARLAGQASTTRSAVVLVTVVAMALSWINWGLGLVAGALLAREVGRQSEARGAPVHYPIIVAAGYSGLCLIWHFGLSGSAPLLAAASAKAGNPFYDLVGRSIPTGETIFHPYALLLSALSIAIATVTYVLLAPGRGHEVRGFSDCVRGGDGADPVEARDSAPPDRTPAARLNDSRILGGMFTVLGLAGIAVVTQQVLRTGTLSLDRINFILLFLGIAIYRTPARYLAAFQAGVGAAAGIILLFPVYAGLMGLINGSGLSAQIAAAMIENSGPESFPVLVWLAAGFVNLFVPSGGGEWTVIGDTILRSAQAHGIPAGKAILAFAAGDQWTNLLQPFWALPLLSICGVPARMIFGYTLVLLVISGACYGVALAVLPY